MTFEGKFAIRQAARQGLQVEAVGACELENLKSYDHNLS